MKKYKFMLFIIIFIIIGLVICFLYVNNKNNENSKKCMYQISYFDTHAHYDWKEFDKDREELFDKFREILCGLVNIGINIESANKVIEYANKYAYMYYSIHNITQEIL